MDDIDPGFNRPDDADEIASGGGFRQSSRVAAARTFPIV